MPSTEGQAREYVDPAPGDVDGMPAVRGTLMPGATTILLGLVLALLTLGAVLGLPLLDRGPFLASPQLPGWALFLAFLATGVCVVQIQQHRQGETINLSEIPLVLGMFLAAPLTVCLARIAADLLVMVGGRTPAKKVIFNVALGCAETALALAVFTACTTWLGPSLPVTWLAAYAGALAANALGIVAIRCVIAAYDGGLQLRAVLRDALTEQGAAPMAVTLGLIAVTSLSATVLNAWLLVASGAFLLLAYRSYAALSGRHLDLERLYRFSQAVSNAAEVDESLADLLGESRKLLLSERAAAMFVSPDGVVARVELGAGDRLTRSEEPLGPEDTWLMRTVMSEDEPLLLPRATRDPAARRWLAAHGRRDAVVVPLRGTTGIVGALLVADRLGDIRSFESGDVLLLETVANQASVALRNGELIGRLRHEALHDSLTGLPNRTQFQRRLGSALDDVRAGRTSGAGVLVLDLDDFKEVNDTLGHQQGDLLLVEVAARLTATVGRSGTVARLGGDEFAILLSDTGDEDLVLRLGRRVLHALEQPVALDGLEVEIGGSMGVALAPAHALDPAALLKRADMAMYDAKTSSRGLRVYEAELDTNSPRRLTLVSELRAALQNGGIEVHVQPQARLSDGQVVRTEALARWHHSELGPISPEEFIPVAERSGLIGPLTSFVLNASLASCAQWRASGQDVGVAVNLSTRSLQDADLFEEVERLLQRHGVPASRLTLEVTEGSVMADPARAVALLHRLRDLGVRLSVDDFGTGYSSLSYLKRLPVQEVKIDRSFITSLREGSEDVAIVRAIVDLGRHLGLEVIAEGIEDQATWDLLTSMGCDLVQGWHLGRPMPTAELLPWLGTRDGLRSRGGLRVV